MQNLSILKKKKKIEKKKKHIKHLQKPRQKQQFENSDKDV